MSRRSRSMTRVSAREHMLPEQFDRGLVAVCGVGGHRVVRTFHRRTKHWAGGLDRNRPAGSLGHDPVCDVFRDDDRPCLAALRLDLLGRQFTAQLFSPGCDEGLNRRHGPDDKSIWVRPSGEFADQAGLAVPEWFAGFSHRLRLPGSRPQQKQKSGLSGGIKSKIQTEYRSSVTRCSVGGNSSDGVVQKEMGHAEQESEGQSPYSQTGLKLRADLSLNFRTPHCGFFEPRHRREIRTAPRRTGQGSLHPRTTAKLFALHACSETA